MSEPEHDQEGWPWGVSPPPRGEDLPCRRKKDVYGRLRVETYVIYDPFTGGIEVNEYDSRTYGYKVAEPNGQGRYPIPSIGLTLGVWDGAIRGVEAPWLRWFDGEDTPVPLSTERAAEALSEAAEAKSEAAEASALLARYRARFGELEPEG